VQTVPTVPLEDVLDTLHFGSVGHVSDEPLPQPRATGWQGAPALETGINPANGNEDIERMISRLSQRLACHPLITGNFLSLLAIVFTLLKKM